MPDPIVINANQTAEEQQAALRRILGLDDNQGLSTTRDRQNQALNDNTLTVESLIQQQLDEGQRARDAGEADRDRAFSILNDFLSGGPSALTSTFTDQITPSFRDNEQVQNTRNRLQTQADTDVLSREDINRIIANQTNAANRVFNNQLDTQRIQNAQRGVGDSGIADEQSQELSRQNLNQALGRANEIETTSATLNRQARDQALQILSSFDNALNTAENARLDTLNRGSGRIDQLNQQGFTDLAALLANTERAQPDLGGLAALLIAQQGQQGQQQLQGGFPGFPDLPRDDDDDDDDDQNGNQGGPSFGIGSVINRINNQPETASGNSYNPQGPPPPTNPTFSVGPPSGRPPVFDPATGQWIDPDTGQPVPPPSTQQ